MRRQRLLVLVVLAAVGAAGVRSASSTTLTPLGSTRALLAGLRSAGRAEAAVQIRRLDPLGGRSTVLRGRLILELPRLARLELDDGQRLTLRADGGDWLQPAMRQLVRAGARSAAGVLRWWGVLLDPEGTAVRERNDGPQQYTLALTETDERLEQRIQLGADGLPCRLTIVTSPDERVEYRVTRWRFMRARGRGDFVLEAPPGFDVVEMP